MGVNDSMSLFQIYDDLANSYLEIVGEIVKAALSIIKQFFAKRGVD